MPDHPGPDRLWRLVERHRISVMGISPTAVRVLMAHGEAPVRAHDLSSLRILGSTGEPWNPEPYRWLFGNVGQGRLPIINYTGGTEISGGILGCFPIAPIKPCAFSGPIPGMAAECLGDDGRPVRGEVGELVITRPWPGMTAGFWRDPERYEETYWSRWPGVWVHGDWARVDEDGFWFIQGRSDDTLKIAGKRLGPAEVESALVGHPAVAEAGVIGTPHTIKGEAVVCFVVLRPGHAAGRVPARGARRPGGPHHGQGPQAREGAVHARAAEDPQRQDHAPGDQGDASRAAGGRPVVSREPGRDRRDRPGDLTAGAPRRRVPVAPAATPGCGLSPARRDDDVPRLSREEVLDVLDGPHQTGVDHLAGVATVVGCQDDVREPEDRVPGRNGLLVEDVESRRRRCGPREAHRRGRPCRRGRPARC